MKKPFLADMLPVNQVEESIHKYRVVEINSGVGSGKNHWANRLLDPKATGGTQYNILYITSRKATAGAEARKNDTKRYIDLEQVLATDTAFGSLKQFGFTVTNSGVEKFVTDCLDKDKTSLIDELCTRLDFIILDEAHSMVTDAVFSDAPFWVVQFLKYALHVNPKLTVIMMTGTPKPIGWLSGLARITETEVEDEYNMDEGWYYEELSGDPEWFTENFRRYDFMDVCYNVHPMHVHFKTRDECYKLMVKRLNEGEKVIYFAEDIDYIRELWKKLNEKKVLPINEIAVGFSREKERSSFTPELPTTQREDIENYLKEHEKLPEHIRLFITTTKFKEGVNIRNKDIKTMMAESLWDSELTQMAGRIRNGLVNFYVVYDRRKHINDKYVYMESLGNDIDTDALNCMYTQYEQEYSAFAEDLIEDRISKGEKTFPFCRYDRLNSQKFVTYEGRLYGEVGRKLSADKLTAAIGRWDDYLFSEGKDESRITWTGESYLKNCFPYSKVHAPKVEPTESRLSKAKADVEALLNDKGWLNTKIESGRKEELLKKIQEIEETYSLNQHKQLKRALNTFGYDIQDGSKNSRYGNFTIIKVETDTNI